MNYTYLTNIKIHFDKKMNDYLNSEYKNKKLGKIDLEILNV